MTREEALVKFKAEEAHEILKKINFKYYNHLLAKKEEFAEVLRNGFWDIVGRLEQYPEFKVQEVQFSVLRAHVMDGTYQWLVELHDKNGDYTREDISQMIDMKPILGIYDECKEELYHAALKYVNTITAYDCDLIALDNFMNRIMYLYLLGVHAFRDIAGDERFEKIETGNVFRVLIGERKDKAFVVFARMQNRDAAEDVIGKLSDVPTESDFSSLDYVLYDFSNYHIADRNICFRNVPFSSFQDCFMENSELIGCKCMFTDWRNSHIKNVIMEGNCMNCADFTGSRFENVSMQGARLDVVPYSEECPVNVAMLPVSFRNAVLKNVDFSGAFLAECDFRDARIGRINFEGADLNGAKFDLKYRDLLDLTDEQKKSINWVKE